MLPDEAAHCQYEMKSFIRLDSGVLYPKGQGKLADSHSRHIDFLAADGLQVLHESGVNRDLPLKQQVLKGNKDKTKLRTSTLKAHLADHASPARSHSCSPRSIIPAVKKSSLGLGNLSTECIAVDEELHQSGEGTVNEIDWKARETRLTAYEDAIDSVIRKVQSDQNEEPDDTYAAELVEDGLSEVTDDVQQIPLDIMKEEREARISDVIDAVIAQAKCPSSVRLQGDRSYSDKNEEVLEVPGSDSHLVESPSSTSLPLQSTSVSQIKSERTLSAQHSYLSADLMSTPSGDNSVGRGGKSRKEKRKSTRSVLSVAESTAVPSKLKLSDFILNSPDNNAVCIEKFSEDRKNDHSEDTKSVLAEVVKDKVYAKVDQWADDDSIVPMAAAESLMKLAGVVPHKKRLRISFGPRNERPAKSPVDSVEYHCAEKFSSIHDTQVSKLSMISEVSVESKNVPQDKHIENIPVESKRNESVVHQSVIMEERQHQQSKRQKSNEKKYRKQAKKMNQDLESKKITGKKEKVCATIVFLLELIHLTSVM
jgi:hypothetical protein